MVYFYFFADWLVDIPNASSTNRVRQTMIHVEDKIYSGSGTNRCSAFLTTKLRIRTRIQTLKRKTEKLLFRDSFSVQFMLRAVCGRKFSRQKNLRVLVIRMRQYFLYLFRNICVNVANFPPNDKKYGAQNTHAPIFFF